MTRLRLATRDGVPIFERDGRVEPAWLATTPDPDSEWVDRMARAGFRAFSFTATANHHIYGLAATAWVAPGVYDWSEFDARIERILERVPDAAVIPRLHLASPPWWDAAFPDEGVGFGVPWESAPPGHGILKSTHASWASAAWRRAVGENLRAWVAHLESRPWADAVVGVLLCGGETEEWIHVGAMRGLFPDVGLRAREGFVEWLRARYGDDATLSRAFRRAASFSEVRPPSVERRRGDPLRPWIDVRRDRDVVDFHRYLTLVAASFVGEAAAALAAASTRRLGVGVWGGYLAEMTYHPDALRFGGTLGFGTLLEHPAVDWFAAPSSYALRDLRRGATVGMLPRGSLRAHGKPGFHESDVRTHVLRDDAGYGRTETLHESLSMLVREASFATGTGLGLWWFDMTGTFHDEPAVIDRLRALLASASSAPTLPRGAVVVDESVLEAWNGFPDRLTDGLPRLLVDLGRTGIDFELVRLADFERAGTYEIAIFPAFERVEPVTRERVARATAAVRLAVFLGRVGLAPTSDGDPPGPSAVTGLALRVSAQAVPTDAIGRHGRRLGRGFWSTHDIRPESDAPEGRVLARRVVDDVPCAWIVPRASGAVAWILDHIFDPIAWCDLFESAGLSIPIAGDAAFRGTHGGWCVTAAGDSVFLKEARPYLDTTTHETFAAVDGRVEIPMTRGGSRRLRPQ